MSRWISLIAGSHHRKTRFHDEKGNLVDAGGVLYAVPAFFSALIKVIFGYRPLRPMISYRAQREIARLIRPEWNVAEFGSGQSTPWLARRCARLLSIEDNPDWFARVQALLAKEGIKNARHELRDGASYARLDDIPDSAFDFALIDGSDRAGCIAAVLPKLKPGGWIYLDNSDKDMLTADGDLRKAEAALIAAAATRNGAIRYFSDFSPTNFFVERGMLARL